MCKPTKENFLRVYYSGYDVVHAPYCPDDLMFLFEDFLTGECKYVVSLKIYQDYNEYINNMGALLKELA